jgi:hypothetical protein
LCILIQWVKRKIITGTIKDVGFYIKICGAQM